MRFALLPSAAALTAAAAAVAGGQPPRAPAPPSPDQALPPHIRRLTSFGERADFSPDGKRLLFIARTYGDVYEYELATGVIRPVTHHYAHEGYTRALYLANGDVLLSGCPTFDAKNPGYSRVHAELFVLDRSFSRPPTALGTRCSEGPAVSRRRLHFAWTHVAAQYPDQMPAGSSRILEADLVYENGTPRLANRRVALESGSLPFRCTLECQNYRPPDERELTFSAYGYQGSEVCGVDLASGRVTNYSHAPDQYDEPEGIFPDGRHTLVESDRQNRLGSGHVDIWKLALDGSGRMTRLTHFSDSPGFKASNPVVCDDGRFMAFQWARAGDPAGFGRGLFLYDLRRAPG